MCQREKNMGLSPAVHQGVRRNEAENKVLNNLCDLAQDLSTSGEGFHLRIVLPQDGGECFHQSLRIRRNQAPSCSGDAACRAEAATALRRHLLRRNRRSRT